MRFAFRVDASGAIGSGHLMRCLTLATAARDHGVQSEFICRAHAGHLEGLVRSAGFPVHLLPPPEHEPVPGAPESYDEWRGVTQEQDARETSGVLRGGAFDWLVVDHYGLDAGWEDAVRGPVKRIAAIDDLANRDHRCDVLLDVTPAGPERYASRVGPGCELLLGPSHALLRPEFTQWRAQSMPRRAAPAFECLLVFMGGTDPLGETARVLQGVQAASRRFAHVDVVVGQGQPDLEGLRGGIASSGLPVTLHVQTKEMARLMAQADLAITAGGGVSWEKCALGLPSLVTVIGDNQQMIAHTLHALGAQRTLGRAQSLSIADYSRALDGLAAEDLAAMSAAAAGVCDGQGTQRVVQRLLAHGVGA